jgi:nucleotidyltransferase/DNA polymerase involved in DNA repair
LCQKPVGVLGNHGACVIAKSYEMKATGVKTGEPVWDAVLKCPQGICIKRDFHWYEVVSRQMLELVRGFSARVEYYSIDEFFFEALPFLGLSYQQTVESMRDRIWEAVRVPVSMSLLPRFGLVCISTFRLPAVVALCGERAGREAYIRRLPEMGFRALSVAPTIIPTAKALVRGLDLRR